MFAKETGKQAGSSSAAGGAGTASAAGRPHLFYTSTHLTDLQLIWRLNINRNGS